MTSEKFIETAKDKIVEIYNMMFEESPITPKDTHLVWFSKTLQHFKALIVVVKTRSDSARYFEVTYNGDRKELYCDSYVKEYTTIDSI